MKYKEVLLENRKYRVYVDEGGEVVKENWIPLICSNCQIFHKCDKIGVTKMTGSSRACEEFDLKRAV